jgi:uncharacterized membrane protein
VWFILYAILGFLFVFWFGVGLFLQQAFGWKAGSIPGRSTMFLMMMCIAGCGFGLSGLVVGMVDTLMHGTYAISITFFFLAIAVSMVVDQINETNQQNLEREKNVKKATKKLING